METGQRILVLNAGSSSLKFAVYRRTTARAFDLALRGQIAGIGTAPRASARDGAGRPVELPFAERVRDARGALDGLLAWIVASSAGDRVVAVGHRVVHGGDRYPEPMVVTPGGLAELHELAALAPLHQLHNLAAIEAAAEQLPDVPQVACFDTSFHRGLPAVARLVPLPAEIRARGVQRYGFHGLSYEYVASALPELSPELAAGQVVVAHLGNGASLCALRAGRSVETTLGFTALDGLCMGTRPGALDPGVVLHLIRRLGLSAEAVEQILYERSGLLGISGRSSDMRELLASDEPDAQLAVEYFVYRAVREIGALAAVLGGLDGLVFTAGIGERSAEIRRRIGAGCAWLGVALEDAANEAHGPRISSAASRVSTWVVPTDEERMIARHTAALLGLGAVSDPRLPSR